MKVLYIAHYREYGEWSKTAINYMLALRACGVDVVCRPVIFKGNNNNLPEEIIEMEQKGTDDVTHCIQHVIPSMINGTKKFKRNVAFFTDDTFHTESNPYYRNLDLVDAIFVPNSDIKENIEQFVSNKIVHIDCPVDIKQSEEEAKEIEVCKHKFRKLENMYKFVFTTSNIKQLNNIELLIKAYLSEFERTDNTVLFINIATEDKQRTTDFVNEVIKSSMQSLGLTENAGTLPHIISLPVEHEYSEEVLKDLNLVSDCFVFADHGIPTSLNILKPMSLGVPAICSNVGAAKSIVDINNKNTGTLISGTMKIASCANLELAKLRSKKDIWFQPNEIELRKAMRFYLENKDEIEKSQCIQRAKMFDHEAIGKKLKEMLND